MNVKANSGDIWVPVTEAGKNTPITGEPSVTAASAPATEEPEEDWFFDSAFITNPEPEPAPVTEPADFSPTKEATAPSEATFSDNAAFEQGKIAGLQEAIIAIMEKKGPVTEQMRRDVLNNTHHGSLVNWVKSFY